MLRRSVNPQIEKVVEYLILRHIEIFSAQRTDARYPETSSG